MRTSSVAFLPSCVLRVSHDVHVFNSEHGTSLTSRDTQRRTAGRMEVPKTVTGRKALKVAELKEVLAGLGLATDGTKAVLLERLESHLAAGDAAGTAEGADQGAAEAAEPPVEEAAHEQPAEQVRLEA